MRSPLSKCSDASHETNTELPTADGKASHATISAEARLRPSPCNVASSKQRVIHIGRPHISSEGRSILNSAAPSGNIARASHTPLPVCSNMDAPTHRAAHDHHNAVGTSMYEATRMPTTSGTATAVIGICPKRLQICVIDQVMEQR